MWSHHDEVEMLTLTVLRISVIEPECFEQLTTLEWLKLNNNEMRSLPYQLMEPVLTSLKYIDIYSEYSVTVSNLPDQITWERKYQLLMS